jgi:hypothetical protein
MGITSPGLTRANFNSTCQKRFESKCGKPDANGCIGWLGSKTRNGYGQMRIGSSDSVRTTAHRVAWVLKRGDIPPEILVLHHCDNPSCVNADHLFLGSPLDNTMDMVGKRRHAWLRWTPWQKLCSTDGERIRDLRNAGLSQQKISNWLGVSRSLISLVLSGRIQHSTLR